MYDTTVYVCIFNVYAAELVHHHHHHMTRWLRSAIMKPHPAVGAVSPVRCLCILLFYTLLSASYTPPLFRVVDCVMFRICTHDGSTHQLSHSSRASQTVCCATQQQQQGIIFRICAPLYVCVTVFLFGCVCVCVNIIWAHTMKWVNDWHFKRMTSASMRTLNNTCTNVYIRSCMRRVKNWG